MDSSCRTPDPLLGSQILVGIIVTLGFILLFIPGVYLALRFSQVKFLVVEGSGVWQAFDESGRMTQGMIWSLLGFTLVSIGIMFLGFVAFGV